MSHEPTHTQADLEAHRHTAGGHPGSRSRRLPIIIVAAVAGLITSVGALYLAAAARTNHVALSSAPRPVSFVKAEQSTFRPSRSCVATIAPWVAAKVGPQFVSAYVGTVLVRPGALVRRGEVLATLDCRESSAVSREIAAQAKALEERQLAAEHEAARLKELSTGGFASKNEEEQLSAKAKSQAAQVEALRASMTTKSLQVDDCVLRAPFAGEISDRGVDPGAYARPGNPIVTVIDRNTVRVVADAPESDFVVVAPGTKVAIHVLSIGRDLTATVSRRAPAADEATRTVRFEVDLPNADRALPVGTTATLSIEVGEPKPAVAIPLRAATVRGEKASIFVVERAKTGDADVARRVNARVLGESGGTLYLDPSIAADTAVVVEGRALLDDGDAVKARELDK